MQAAEAAAEAAEAELTERRAAEAASDAEEKALREARTAVRDRADAAAARQRRLESE